MKKEIKEKIIIFLEVVGMLTVAFLTILAFILLIKAWLFREFYYTRFTFDSPDNEYRIVIKGNGTIFFSDENLIIYAYKNNFKGYLNKVMYATSLSDDGGSLGKDNVAISWEGNKAYLTIKGEEQKNEYIEINFQDNITFKHKGLDYKVNLNKGNKIIKSYSENEYYNNKDVELHNIDIEFLIDGKYISMEDSFNLGKIDIDDFVITLDYELEKKMATINRESKGHAEIYKNNALTLIICRYDRGNSDYNVLENENYLKYVIGDSNLNYSYEICKP